ncbi:MAG: GNAT family N-acetyltransferase [Oleiphilaceae bacterium]|nr:GNAT family N-acetyltransferase [Oleiphilaceae bacterium]
MPLAKRFYSEQQYRCRFDRNSQIYALYLKQKMIACVQIDREHNYYFLRAMVVAKNYRRQGLASQLLNAVAPYISTKDCWCLPFVHLVSLYQTAGFSEHDETTIPPTISTRLQRYHAQGKLLVAMCKRA